MLNDLDRLSEDEQRTVFIGWCKKYLPVVLLGVAIGFGGLYGYRYYEQSQKSNLAKASELLTFVVQNDNKLRLEANESNSGAQQEWSDVITTNSDVLRANYEGSYYAVLATLIESGNLIRSGSAQQAELILSDLFAQTDDELFKNVLRLQLAQAQWGQDKTDEALETVSVEQDDSNDVFAALFLEMKGDIYAVEQRYTDALEAYTNAKKIYSGTIYSSDASLALKIQHVTR